MRVHMGGWLFRTYVVSSAKLAAEHAMWDEVR